MAGVIDIAMLLVILGGAYWVLKSGALNSIAALPPAPVAVAPVTGADGATTPVVPGTGTETPAPTTGTPTIPTSTGNPLLDALNGLLGGGTGGANTIPPGGVAPSPVPVIPGSPIYGGDPAECSSRYHGRCDTECASGNASLCNACQLACGGAQIGAVNVLPPQGGANQSLCSSRYNGRCNTECEGSRSNSTECQECKVACGSFVTYIQTPQSLMTATVFGDDHHSYYSSWGNIGITNAR